MFVVVFTENGRAGAVAVGRVVGAAANPCLVRPWFGWTPE
jgi:hypothetical protein